MRHQLVAGKYRKQFAMEVEAKSGQDIMNCYQCGKCSAGCPVNYNMEYQPNEIMRMVQLGLEDEVLESTAIWQCISCETCTTRCPRENDLARIMDTLRAMSAARRPPQGQAVGFAKRLWSRGLKYALRADMNPEVSMFNSVFLENVRRHGKSFEPALLPAFNASKGHVFRNMLKGLTMLFKGKIKPYPRTGRGAKRAREIFEGVEKWRKREL
ncbi:MAG: 4Fe-4S dicluster domain-containing protein [bacterium]